MRFLASMSLAVCLLASTVFARPGTVRTKDGRELEGDITESLETVTISGKGIKLSLARQDVASITYGATIEERYKQRLAALPPGAGARSHVDLARWLYEGKAYDLARKEVTTALELDPNNADAFLLRQTIDRTAAWEKRAAAGTAPTTQATQPGALATSATQPARLQRKLLTAEQVNMIRQREVKETERLRVRFDNNVVRRYIESEQRDLRTFLSSPDMVKAFAIMKKPEFRKDVVILNDPASMLAWRTKVQPFLRAGCATASCHGGTKGGAFELTSPAETDAVTYTNFYILTTYSVTTDRMPMKLIDRQQPDNSLVIQYAMPRSAARHPHPDTPGFAPIFRNQNDFRLTTLRSWIATLTVPQPDYGIDSPAPDGAATQPAGPGTFGTPTPEAGAQPPPPPPPPGNAPDGGDRGNANESMKEIRERLRPIRGI